MENLAKAIIEVMKEVDGIDKSMTVGSGESSYKGVPDQEVKKIVRASMIKNGLTLVPTGVEETTEVSRWEETYNGKVKQKQSVFTKVTTKYLLLHTSGESMLVAGYGHGVDSQDKGAGKATTYALKYLLLYLFLIPTGKIDDADSTHSDSIEAPKENKPEAKVTQWLTEEQFNKAMKADKKGIQATLAAYNGLNGKGMKKDYLVKLTAQLPNAQ